MMRQVLRMKGAKKGVAKQLCDEESRAVYMHWI